MSDNIFSTYSQGENRVTSTFVAVLKALSLNLNQIILRSCLDEDAQLDFFNFKDQPKKGKDGTVPDAILSADFKILVETKIKKNSLHSDQLKGHLKELNIDKRSYLFIITPDDNNPIHSLDLPDSRNVKWINFINLGIIFQGILENYNPSEKETYLIQEFLAMMDEEGLTQPERDVVVVAARQAWQEYLDYGAYVCQPKRSFRDVKYMAFYTDGEIKEVVPKVRTSLAREATERIRNASDQRQKDEHAEKLREMVKAGIRNPNEDYQVILLSGPKDMDTKELNNPIPHIDKGRGKAFTMGQRYVFLKDLKNAESTNTLMDSET